MKMVKLYILPLALIICSLIAVAKGVAVKKESEVLSSKLATEKSKLTGAGATKKTTPRSQMIYAQWLMEAAAQKIGVDVRVAPTETSLLVSGTPGILDDYPRLITFLSKMDGMPYPDMKLKDLCIGSACSSGLSMLFDFGTVVRDEDIGKVTAKTNSAAKGGAALTPDPANRLSVPH